jgi:excisionase family DNA binding protein
MLDLNFDKKLLSRKEAAKFLGVAEDTLAIWACNKRYALPYVKIGRLVKYKLSDLNAFIESRTQNGGDNV